MGNLGRLDSGQIENQSLGQFTQSFNKALDGKSGGHVFVTPKGLERMNWLQAGVKWLTTGGKVYTLSARDIQTIGKKFEEAGATNVDMQKVNRLSGKLASAKSTENTNTKGMQLLSKITDTITQENVWSERDTLNKDVSKEEKTKSAQARWEREYGNIDTSEPSKSTIKLEEEEIPQSRTDKYEPNRIKGPTLSELSNPSSIDASRLERAVRTMVQDKSQGFKMKGGEEKQQQNQLNGFIATFRQAVDDTCEEFLTASKKGAPLTKGEFIDLVNNKVLEGLKPKIETIESEDFALVRKEMEDRNEADKLEAEITSGQWQPGEERDVLVEKFIGAKHAEGQWNNLMKRDDMQAALAALHESLSS